MKVNIKARNLVVTDAIREYLEKRLAKFDKILGGEEEATATLSVQKDRHKVEVMMVLDGGVILRGEEEGPNLYACVDAVEEKLDRQVRKHKTRLAKRVKEGSHAKQAYQELEEEADDRQLVREKHFNVKPMSVEEAIMQMNLLGHSFFVFHNEETKTINVLYQRKDGNYGILIPE